MKKSLGKRVLKWTLWSLLALVVLILVGVTIVIHFIFTPAKLTPLVEKTAKEYLNAEVHFGNIELTFFSTFPDFGIQLDDASVISGTFRDSTANSEPTMQDSLMNIKSCLLTINPIAYLTKNRIVVKDFVLEQPEIYAYVDSAGVPNWDILRIAADTTTVDTTMADTTTFDSGIRLRNVRIRNGRLVFDDRNTRLYTRLTGINLGVDGYLGKRRSRLKLDFSTENVLFWQEGQLLVNRLAFGIETGMKINRDSLLYTLEKAVVDVNGIRFGAGGTLRGDTVNHTLLVNLKYGIHIPTLKTLLDLVPDTILHKTENVEVRGDVLCQGEIKGIYGQQNIPLLTSEFRIKDGFIAYPGMPSKIDTLNVDLFALIDLQKEQESYVNLRNFCMKDGGIDIDMAGDAERLLTAPTLKAEVKALVNFEELTKIFPLADGITCRGTLNTSLKTDVLVEDVRNADYGKLRIGGWCQMKDVNIFIPKDSIVMNVKSAGLVFAANRKNTKSVQGTDLLNGVVGYSGLDIHVRNKVRLLMDTTYLALRTSPLKDTSVVASMGANLHLGRMVFIVRDTLLVGLKQANAKASLLPSKRNKKVPQINAELQVDSLRLRAMGNRLNFAKAEVQVEAVRSKRNTKIWLPTGYVDFTGLRAYTPYFPVRMRMPGTRLRFDRNEIQLDDIASEKKDKYAFLQEKLWKEDNLLIDRSPETIFFNGNQIVKLPSEQSVVALLKEEPVVSPVFDGFAKIGELVFNTKSVSLTILGKSLLEPLLLHFKSVDEIRHSGLGTEIKLCLLYYTDKNEFKKIQSRFINIFPQVEQIKVEVVPGISSDAIGDYPVIQLKEKGVKDWILQPMISSGMLKSLLQVAELYLCEDGAVILIDEFENSLGVNCMDELTEDLVASERDVQFIITSHHPYIINNIPYRNWKIVTRKAGTVVVKNASDYKIGQSKHDAFIQLLQLDEFTEGVE